MKINPPHIYVASKAVHGARWRQLRNTYPIISTWIDEADDGTTVSWLDLWQRCIYEASRSDLLIACHQPGEQWKGAYVEIGAALAVGTPVFVAGDPPGSWINHPLVTTSPRTTFDDIDGLFEIAFDWWYGR